MQGLFNHRGIQRYYRIFYSCGALAAPYALRAGNPSGEKGVKRDVCLSIADTIRQAIYFVIYQMIIFSRAKTNVHF
jgi:hypothetical protein